MGHAFLYPKAGLRNTDSGRFCFQSSQRIIIADLFMRFYVSWRLTGFCGKLLHRPSEMILCVTDFTSSEKYVVYLQKVQNNTYTTFKVITVILLYQFKESP